MVLIPQKAASYWWPADDAPKVAAVLIKMMVSVSEVIDGHRMGMLSVERTPHPSKRTFSQDNSLFLILNMDPYFVSPVL